MRVVFDTHVLVSAFLARGLCADLLRLVLSRRGSVPLKQIDAIEVLLRDQPIAPRPAAIPPRPGSRARWRRRVQRGANPAGCGSDRTAGSHGGTASEISELCGDQLEKSSVEGGGI